MKTKTLFSILAAWTLPIAGHAQLTTDFDSLTAGAVTSVDLDSVTTGGTWTLNTDRGAMFTIENDGTTDQALFADDGGGNAGLIEFFSVALDSAFDVSGSTAELTFQTATRRTGNNKGLVYTILDSNDAIAAEIVWQNNGGLTLNGVALADSDFESTPAWSSSASGLRNVSLRISATTCELDFGASAGSAATLNGATDIAKIVVSSDFTASQAKGLFVNDLNLDTFSPTNPPTIDSFTASLSEILDDREIELSWQTTYATSVEISDIGAVASDGTTTVLVTLDSLPKTFTLTATNPNAAPPDDVVTAMVTITERGVVAPAVLMAHWPFDGDLGEEIIGWQTVKVNGPDGFDDISFTADVPALIDGRVSQSLNFTEFNADDYIDTNFGHVIGSSPRSVSFWAKNGQFLPSTIFSYGQNGAGAAFIATMGTLGDAYASFRNSASIGTPDNIVQPDVWTHITYVYAGFSGDIPLNITIYVNGAAYRMVNFSNGNPADTEPGILNIGRNRANGGAAIEYAKKVSLSELVFYKGELSPAQVSLLAAGADPAAIEGPPTQAIQPLPLQITGFENTGGLLDLTFQATEGTILELHGSPDLIDFTTIAEPNVYGGGPGSLLEIGFDPVAQPRYFYRLENLDLTPPPAVP